MSFLVDYRCTGCGGRSEFWVEQPVPARATCPACRAEARRVFGVGRVGSRGAAVPPAPSGTGAGDEAICLRNSGVPAICHMHPSAARRWAAMARGDDRAVAREIAYQESAVAAGTLNPKDAMRH